VDVADKIIIEVNTSMPSFRKMHDMCKDLRPPARQPLLINRVDDRIGEPVVRFDPEKVIAIVESQLPDNGSELKAPGPTEVRIAEHIIEFLEREVLYGRMPANLLPLQSGGMYGSLYKYV
jgi:acetyl-CoA hydrolase